MEDIPVGAVADAIKGTAPAPRTAPRADHDFSDIDQKKRRVFNKLHA
jgi:hypothetical protein